MRVEDQAAAVRERQLLALQRGVVLAHARSVSVRAVADEISLGPWTISAERDDDGALSVEITLEGETRATFKLPPAEAEGSAGAPKGEDMDF